MGGVDIDLGPNETKLTYVAFYYVGGMRSYDVGMRTLCRGHDILCRGNEFLCCGNEIIMSWEQDKYVLETRSYVVGMR